MLSIPTLVVLTFPIKMPSLNIFNILYFCKPLSGTLIISVINGILCNGNLDLYLFFLNFLCLGF